MNRIYQVVEVTQQLHNAQVAEEFDKQLWKIFENYLKIRSVQTITKEHLGKTKNSLLTLFSNFKLHVIPEQS